MTSRTTVHAVHAKSTRVMKKETEINSKHHQNHRGLKVVRQSHSINDKKTDFTPYVVCSTQ